MMMIATKTTITLPSSLRKSGTRSPSRSGRRWLRWLGERRDEESRPGRTGHGDGRSGRDVDGGRGTELVGLAFGLHQDAAEPAGRDRDRDRGDLADERRRREGVRSLRAAEHGEHHEDDQEADDPA